MLKQLLSILGCMLLPWLAMAQTGGVQGRVLDKESGETMIGVTVLVEGTSKGGVTDLEGKFAIAGLTPGNVKLLVTFIGYEDIALDATVKANETVDLGDISMLSTSIGLEEVEVFADMVEDRKTPIAATNIQAAEITEQLGGMQLPELMNSTPGVYATQGSGAFADSRMNIRGFDQTEILFMINGVPLNDMENGLMYWSNFAGLSEVTRNMQIQRGLGASKLAVNSVGGTVNIVTKPSERKKGGQAEIGFGNGSWSNRYRLTLNSGQLKGGWAFTFQGSRTTGEGYVKGAYVDAWSYFLTASKDINDRHSLLFTAFGAPVSRGRAFSTSTAEYEKRGSFFFNPAMGYYNGEFTNVSQNFSHKPQITLMHLWTINEKMLLTTSAYTSIAYAYGTSPVRSSNVGAAPTTSEGLQNLEYMREQNSTNTQTINNPNGDFSASPFRGLQSNYILEARYNNHNWYGAISNLNYKVNENIDLVFGIDFRDYQAQHYAKVHHLLGGEFWLDKNNNADRDLLVPNRIARVGDRINYDYDGNVRWGSGFGQIEYTKGKITAFASANFSRTQMWRVGNFWNGESFNINNSFGPSDKRVFTNYNVKMGANYRINGRHNLFINGGTFTRAPYFANSFENNRYNNRYLIGLTSEKIQAAEIGYSYRSPRLRANLNAYYAQWNDRAFSYFATDPATGTRTYFSIVGQSAIHRGVEFDFSFDLVKDLQVRGMASMGDWFWANNVEATVTDDFGNVGQIAVVSKDLPVGDAAQSTAFLGLHYKGIKDMYFGVRANYFARLYEQYDPAAYTASSVAEIESRRPVRQLPSYHQIDIYGGYYFKVGEYRARAGFNVHNLTNQIAIRRSDQRFGGENYSFGINFNANVTLYF